jgi:DeoR family transcriptional regulator of aga operon
MASTASDRAAAILREVQSAGEVSVEELSERLGVSPPTIRRDLSALEAQGLLSRTHGGATAVRPIHYEVFAYDSSYLEQEGRYAEEKRRIGLAAADLVGPGETVGLTAGTTVTQVARSLRHRRGIAVVTNTVNVAMELSRREDLSVTVVGGQLRGGWFSLVGAQALAAVRETFLDRVFVGVNAVDARRGLTCHHPEEAAVNRALVDQARERIVVADRSKLGRVVRCLICPTEEVQMLITDRDATDDDTAPFVDRGIEVRRV